MVLAISAPVHSAKCAQKITTRFRYALENLFSFLFLTLLPPNIVSQRQVNVHVCVCV